MKSQSTPLRHVAGTIYKHREQGTLFNTCCLKVISKCLHKILISVTGLSSNISNKVELVYLVYYCKVVTIWIVYFGLLINKINNLIEQMSHNFQWVSVAAGVAWYNTAAMYLWILFWPISLLITSYGWDNLQRFCNASSQGFLRSSEVSSAASCVGWNQLLAVRAKPLVYSCGINECVWEPNNIVDSTYAHFNQLRKRFANPCTCCSMEVVPVGGDICRKDQFWLVTVDSNLTSQSETVLATRVTLCRWGSLSISRRWSCLFSFPGCAALKCSW